MHGGSVTNAVLLEVGGRGVRFPLSQPSISQGPRWGLSRAGISADRLSSPRPGKQRLSCCLRGRVTGGSGRGHSANTRAPLSPALLLQGPHHGGLPDLASRGQSPASPSVLMEPLLSGSETACGWSCSQRSSWLVQRALVPEALWGGLWGDNHARGGARRLSSGPLLRSHQHLWADVWAQR